CQRGKSDFDGLALTVPGNRLGGDGRVGHVGAAEFGSVTVQDFAPLSGAGNANAEVFTDNGRHVADHNDGADVAAATPYEGEDAVLCVICFQPVEPGRLRVEFVECRLCGIKVVQPAHQRLHALVHRVVEQMPVERL